MKLVKVLTTGALLMSLTGCYSLTHTAGYQPDGASVEMTRDRDARVIHHFKAEQKGVWLLTGLIPISTPDTAEMIRKEAQGRPVQGLVVRSEMSFVDGLISVGIGAAGSLLIGGMVGASPAGQVQASALGALLGLVIPHFRTVTVEGDIVAPAARQ